MALAPSAFAAESVTVSQSSPPPEVCYPTSVSQSEDGTEIRKYYDLGPEEDPAGIPRSDFEQDGFRYTPHRPAQAGTAGEREPSAHRDRLSGEQEQGHGVRAGPAPTGKRIHHRGWALRRADPPAGHRQVEVAGYGSSTREVSATRSYPNLASQDTANIPRPSRTMAAP